MQPLRFPTTFLDHRFAIPRQIALLTRAALGHERRAHQPVLDQLCTPLGVSNIGFAARHVPRMASIDHPDLPDSILQHPMDGFPIHASGFHPDQRHLPFRQPVSQQQQLRRGRTELCHLLAAATRTIRRT